jgi:hypothetical protein
MMRKMRSPFVFTCLTLVALLGIMASLRPQQTVAAPFGAGNIVVYRVGDGNTALSNTGSPVFLDEYTPAGVLVRSIPVPTAPIGSNNPLIASGVAGSEGGLNRSTDGRYLVFAGYNAQLGGTTSLAGSDAAVVNRVIGRVDAQGNVNTTTTLSNFAAFDNPREVASDNGSRFWGVSGNGSANDPTGLGGVFYTTLGASSGTTITEVFSGTLEPTNLRSVNIGTNGQLYVSSQQGEGRGINSVGTGLPTTAVQPIDILPGQAGTRGTTNSPTMRDFVVLDLNNAVPGADTIYSANEYNGIRKYIFNGTTWLLSGIVGDVTPALGTGEPVVGEYAYRRIDVSVSGNTVTVFATRYQIQAIAQDPAENPGRMMITAETDGELVSVTDTSGPTGSFNGAASLSVIVPLSANKAIRGVALAPVDPLAPTPTNTTAPTATNTATATTQPSATSTTDPAASPTATTDPSQPTATATTTAQPTATTNPNGGPQNPVWLPLLHK